MTRSTRVGSEFFEKFGVATDDDAQIDEALYRARKAFGLYIDEAYVERRTLLYLKLDDEFGASNSDCLDVERVRWRLQQMAGAGTDADGLPRVGTGDTQKLAAIPKDVLAQMLEEFRPQVVAAAEGVFCDHFLKTSNLFSEPENLVSDEAFKELLLRLKASNRAMFDKLEFIDGGVRRAQLVREHISTLIKGKVTAQQDSELQDKFDKMPGFMSKEEIDAMQSKNNENK